MNCGDQKAKLNVHVNQLKLVKSQRAADDTANHDSTQPVPIPKKSQTVQIDHNPGQFLDYLEDFEDSQWLSNQIFR